MQALCGRMTAVLRAVHAGEKMNVMERERCRAPWIDDAVGRRQDNVRGNESPRTLANPSVASDIDLADSIPRRPALLDANAIIVSNYARVQLPARGWRAEGSDGNAKQSE
jgi:hypothetical protein